MTHSDRPGGEADMPEQRPATPPERRPRTAYLWYRRYREVGRLALLAGGASGLLLSGAALLPPLLAGERVPAGSFLVATLLVLATALVPYAVVRWRWSVWRRRLEED